MARPTRGEKPPPRRPSHHRQEDIAHHSSAHRAATPVTSPAPQPGGSGPRLTIRARGRRKPRRRLRRPGFARPRPPAAAREEQGEGGRRAAEIRDPSPAAPRVAARED